jgi:hypothetical protein
MNHLIQSLRPVFEGIVGQVILFVVGSFIFYHLAKLKEQRGVALTTLQIIETVLRAKLGDKASKILNIWVEGLKLIQDGEFSKDDAVDQFLRYLRLNAAQNGIELSDEDINSLHTLVLSTLDTFLGKKPAEIQRTVNQFAVMSAKHQA